MFDSKPCENDPQIADRGSSDVKTKCRSIGGHCARPKTCPVHGAPKGEEA